MSRIDEWSPVFPPNEDAFAVAMRARPRAVTGSATSGITSRIYDALGNLHPNSGLGVHFYLGEGLRWIRVGFSGDEAITPAAAIQTGRTIKSCLSGDDNRLFFHALRPHDMLFFLERGDADSLGLPARCYGMLIEDWASAWGGGSTAARRKAA